MLNRVVIENGYDCVQKQQFSSVNSFCRNILVALHDDYVRYWHSSLESIKVQFVNKGLLHRSDTKDYKREN